MILLSIIVPIYNRESLVESLYNTLKLYNLADVQIIIVDDGSTDNTVELLKSTFKDFINPVKILSRENSGPGGARNFGLKHVESTWVWFVDSDDAITIDAYEYLKNHNSDVDFIDFNIQEAGSVVSSMTFESGTYEVDETIKNSLINNFGRICTKIFHQNFLARSNFKYPEYCVYEDNYLSLTLPFKTERFNKVNLLAYIHNQNDSSVTRSLSFSERSYDRVLTSYQGFVDAAKFVKDQKQAQALWNRFTELFLYNSIYLFKEDFSLTNFSWLERINRISSTYNKLYPSLKDKLNFEVQNAPARPVILVLKNMFHLFPVKNPGLDFYREKNKRNWEHSIKF